jgi:hypothetical protein
MSASRSRVVFRETPAGVEFAVKAVPGASRSRVLGPHGDALRVASSAPPEGGKANKEIARIVAEFFAVRAADVEITRGLASPRKQVVVAGLTAARAEAIIAERWPGV